MLETIEQKYTTWYEVFNTSYLPIIMQRQKWHFSKENLVEGDIVYFKLTKSKMSSSWKVGKVERVTLSKDGFVRHAVILYKDVSGDCPEDWAHRSVERPVRNIIKLFNIQETSLMEDIKAARNLALRILDSNRTLGDLDRGVHGHSVDVDDLPSDDLDNGVLSLEDNLTEGEVPSTDSPKAVVPDSKPSSRRQRTEVEKLEIDLKGRNCANSNVGSVFSDEQPFQNDMNDFDLDFDVYYKQSDNDLYENFIESKSFDDYILLT